MVALGVIEASDARIKTRPPGLDAVFVGATNGVGETTSKQFCKYAVRPRVYFVRRSREVGGRIKQECEALSPEGTFVSIQRETSLMRNVDAVCEEIKNKEESVSLLFLSVGTLQVDGTTFEDKIHMGDFEAAKLGLMTKQSHMASMTTLVMERDHQAAPEVSFVHNFPGLSSQELIGARLGLMRTLKTVFILLAPLVNMPLEEARDRHLFLCTSAGYGAGVDDKAAGVALADGLALARGTDGQNGSGVYSIDAYGESAKPKVESLAG
ncbi:hypothetical protein LTR27_009589 [Elasticomyces elasticus]|nr:hypothetical protein LTR27_009589 [Elasticomyces elasticus]